MSNTPLQSAKRRFRLQFSLRMLLLLMAAVGVGMLIFRWPWVEVEQHFDPQAKPRNPADDPFYDGPLPAALIGPPPVWEKQTSYRRNWRGQPVKHGAALYFEKGVLHSEIHFYDDLLHGRWRTFDGSGRLLVEQVFRGGVRHGPLRGGDGEEWIWQGNYEQGLWHGKWRGLVNAHHYFMPFYSDQFDQDGSPSHSDFSAPSDPLLLESEWQHGQRHGHWRWLTRAGKLIRTADYERDELVRWNDQPVVAEFRQWLESIKASEPRLVESILATQQKTWHWRRSWEERLLFELEDPNGPGTLLAVHVTRGALSRLRAPADAGSFIPYLCEVAALNQCLFETRYGSLWLVGPDGLWSEEDSTGMTQINFPAGSQDENAWQELIPVTTSNAQLGDCLTRLLHGTGWTFDITAVETHFARVTGPQHDRLKRLMVIPEEHELLAKLRRCDALGLTLFLSGCRCELRGNKLIITPRGERIWSEPILYPHMGTSKLPPTDHRGKRGSIAPQPEPPASNDPFQ